MIDIRHGGEPAGTLRTSRSVTKTRKVNVHIEEIDKKGKWVTLNIDGKPVVLSKKDSVIVDYKVTFDDRDF